MFCTFMGLISFGTIISSQKQDNYYFKHKKASSCFFENTTKIEYCNGNQKIGYLYYTKIPLFAYYVVYDFYVHPNYRNKGHGTRLLNYACDHLKWQGASKVYVQPGPFEIYKENFVDTSSYELKLARLVKLYQKNQFISVNRLLQYLAYILYKCIRIDEDSRYLMVRVL